MGRPEFQQVVAQVPAEEVLFISNPVDTVLAKGQQENISIYAPANKVNKINNLWFFAPTQAGATTGEHEMTVMCSQGTVFISFGSSKNTDHLDLRYNYWRIATNSTCPTTESAQVTNITETVFDDVNGLRLKYINNLDVDQTNERTINLMVKQYEKGGSN